MNFKPSHKCLCELYNLPSKLVNPLLYKNNYMSKSSIFMYIYFYFNHFLQFTYYRFLRSVSLQLHSGRNDKNEGMCVRWVNSIPLQRDLKFLAWAFMPRRLGICAASFCPPSWARFLPRRKLVLRSPDRNLSASDPHVRGARAGSGSVSHHDVVDADLDLDV